MNENSSIRHYLALTLWKTATTAPAPTMFALATGNQEFLGELLLGAAQINPGGDENFDISTIEIQLRRVAERPAMIIQLPPPFKCPEPHLIAVVLDKKLPNAILKSDLEGGTIEFFTLEEPPETADHRPTILCSRDENGVHHNHGAGPLPSFDNFCDRLKQMYNQKPWWRFW